LKPFLVSGDLFVVPEHGEVCGLNGDFKAKYATLQSGLDFDMCSEGSVVRTVQCMEWAASVQQYMHAARYSGSYGGIGLLRFKIDRYMTPSTYLSAQARVQRCLQPACLPR